MKRNTYILLLSFLFGFPVLAQNDSITVLEEVILDTKLKEFSTGQNLIKISDSDTKINRPLLTSILKFNTPVFFKENGLGMVSSPSFRGTTASQTAVLWNGLNINSQFNGQTDFNTLNAAAYDQIAVRGGGGSVVYGTGAIGGTVHLNTELSFKEKLNHDVFLRYGSFNTLDARYQFKTAKGDWSLTLSGARNSSDNDYTYPDGQGKNVNGQFYNNSFTIGLGYRIDERNSLKFYSELFDGERHFSLIRPSETKTKYQDLNSRNLLEWESEFSRFTSVAKLAFFDESYKYFGNIASGNYSSGEAESLIAKHDLSYSLSETIELSSVLTNTYTSGRGTDIVEDQRNIFSAAFLMKHRLTQKFSYEAGFRKEMTANYESPFLFSTGARYQFSDFYGLKFNASRNFRIPTFNDLYWGGAGNTGLEPETSLQGEVGNSFRWDGLEVILTAYYIDITDMIQWLPESSGLWRPQNKERVQTYGLEALLNWKKQLSESGFLNLKGTYAYTRSENKNTGNQLIYVPYHKATANFGYSWNGLEVDYQFLYNGEVFTRSDNDSRYNLKAYTISNLAVSYGIGKRNNYRLGARVNNLFDQAYKSVEDRWMPGINYSIYLNLNF